MLTKLLTEMMWNKEHSKALCLEKIEIKDVGYLRDIIRIGAAKSNQGF